MQKAFALSLAGRKPSLRLLHRENATRAPQEGPAARAGTPGTNERCARNAAAPEVLAGRLQ
ncbi:MAG: hypothetical protein IT518_29220 [Burkholderiales bacterium]|nr:hypothetical protein [Burkholderiales bacterium]